MKRRIVVLFIMSFFIMSSILVGCKKDEPEIPEMPASPLSQLSPVDVNSLPWTADGKVLYTDPDIDNIEREYIVICTYRDLDNVRNDLSANYILANDIDCYGSVLIPLTYKMETDSESNGFSGIFNGNTYTLKEMILAHDYGMNIHMNVLFYRLDENAVLKNLKVSGVADYAYEAGFVYRNYGLIKNCESRLRIRSASMGGFVRENEQSGKIIGCYNFGEMYGSLAGISYFNEGLIEGCVNSAEMYGNQMTGISFGSGVIKDCYNYGRFYFFGELGKEAVNGYHNGTITYYGISENGNVINCYDYGKIYELRSVKS